MKKHRIRSVKTTLTATCMALVLLAAAQQGGRENIVLVDACMTRLRVTVKDPAKVADLAAWKAEGALSLLVKGDGIQAVYGPKADVLKSDINDIL